VMGTDEVSSIHSTRVHPDLSNSYDPLSRK
jgi:hypothetical protein